MVTRRELTAEVLELGQTLFESMLEGRSASGSRENQLAVDPEESRLAADEFFIALRLLLGLDEERS